MQIIKYFYLLFILLIFSPGVIYAQETIKSASEYDYPPFSIVTEKGEADGFSVELLRASLKAVGLDVEFYVGPWAEIKQDLAKGKIQVLPLVGRTPEREKKYDFSVPYLTNYGGVFVRKDQTSIKTLKDLADKEIIVMKGDNAEEFLLRENVSKHIITTDSFEEAFKRLSEGKHDAVVVQQLVGRQLIKKLGITNVIYKSKIDKYKQDWTFAVKKGNRELLAILNEGLSRIIINGTFDIIHDKWFGYDAAGFPAAKEDDRIPLTAQEQAWIKKHPEITLGGGISFEPFIMYDHGEKVIGYDADIIKIVAERTGLKVRFELGKWDEIQERARKRELDGLTSAMQTKERAKIYNSSKQYLNYTSLIIVKKGNPSGIHSIEDISGKRVALQMGNASKDILLEEGKKVEFVYFDTIHELIKAVVSGKADFTILDESAFYVARQLMLESMIEAPFTIGEGHTLHFLIRKDWPELVSIINKGIHSIPDETKNSLKNKWFGLSGLEIKNVGKEYFPYAKKIIKQKAEDVARQVEIYLTAYPDKTLKDLQNDPEFQKIAIQPVGETGYTVISDYNKLITLFHPNKKLIGHEIKDLGNDYPILWELLKQAKGGHEVSGMYKFPDSKGIIRDKYLFIKIPKIKTADGVGMSVAATTYLNEYEKIALTEKKKESLPIIPLVWMLGVLIIGILFLLILNKLNIINLEKNVIMLFLAIALLLIIGLFIFNAYNISNNLRKAAIENYYDILRATASTKHVNIKQHISHVKSSFKVIRSMKTILNEDLRKLVDFGEDFIEVFRTDSNGRITHSSDLSNIGLSRFTDEYFKNANEKIYITPLYRSSTLGKIIFTISAPYKDGVLVARMGLKHIYEIISKTEGLGKSGESLLAYRNKNGNAVFFTEGRFIAEAEARDVIPKEDVNIPITQALMGNEKEFSNYVDYRNVPVFAVTKYIEEIDAGLVVKIDQKETFESVSGNIKQIWYSTAIVIFAIIIIGIIFYFLLTYSLRREVKNKTNDLKKTSMVLSEKIALLKNSERKLLSASQLNENIIASSPVGILIYNAAGDCINSNDTAAELMGETKAQILQQNYHQLDSWKKSGLYDIVLSSIQEKTKKRQEIKLKTIFEKVCTLDIQLVPFNIEDDPFLLIMFEDISDRKKAEEEREALESRLQQSQKMESIGTLAGGIAHDFNNVLYPIIGFTELSIQELPRTHHVQENLQDILDGAKRARDLVKQILQFSRQEKQTLQPTILKPVVEEVIKLLKTTIPANIDIQGHLYNGEDYVLCDATEIHEIVMNLCTNAYHSLEENGGRIIVRLNKQNPSPDLNLPSGEYICLSVCDNGVGIPEEIIDKIFEPYLTTKKIGKGSGLGLSVVHGIVSNYKGSISVESCPGKGSDFHVFLPITTQSRIVKQKSIKDKSLGGTENILFVDDEASIIKLATRILEQLGYTITGKTSCIEALELFTQKPDGFDLVITDMAMPIMTGTEFAKKILKIQPDIPIILCTGFSENVDSKIAKSIGIKEYIKKPILVDELTLKIRKILDQSSKG